MDTLRQDLRYAIRGLIHAPGFTIIVVLILGLGIGANTTMFSVMNAALLRPSPVEDPGTLIRVYTSEWDGPGIITRRFGGSSYPDYQDIRQAMPRSIRELGAFFPTPLSLAGTESADVVGGTLVSANYFRILRSRPVAGRYFLETEDDAPGRDAVAVISRNMWQSRFDSDPSVIGQPLVVNGMPFTIIGVAPDVLRSITGEQLTEVWLPLSMTAQARPGEAAFMEQRSSRWLRLIGRVAPDAGVREAQAALGVIGRRLGEAHPQESGGRAFTVDPANTLVGLLEGSARIDAQLISGLLMTVVGIVLMIACANLANLLLTRGSARRREIAVRLSLGASRSRLIRQLLTETMVLALLGGVAGLLAAGWGAELIRLLPIPVPLDLSLDWRVITFTIGLTLFTAALCGLAPALQSTHPDLVPALKDSPRAPSRRSRLRSALVAGQLALSLVLLAAGGLLLRSLRELDRGNPGFETSGLVTAGLELSLRGYTPETGADAVARLLERIRSLPGVQNASVSRAVLFSGTRARWGITIPGYTPAPEEQMVADGNVVDSAYFSTLGIPLLRGRAPVGRGAREVVVSEAMAARYWPGRDVVGQTLRFGDDSIPAAVVGVVRDAIGDSFRDGVFPMFYAGFPAEYASTLTLVVRTAGAPAAIVPALRRELYEIDRFLAFTNIATMPELMRTREDPSRVMTGVVAVFGGLALALAALGLYGMLSHGVAQRSHEIGVRMALGAARDDVVQLVFRDALRPTVIGGAIGVVLAAAASLRSGSMLYGVRPVDPLTFAGTLVVLGLTAALAAFIPARRASRVDPAVALRAE